MLAAGELQPIEPGWAPAHEVPDERGPDASPQRDRRDRFTVGEPRTGDSDDNRISSA